METQKFDMKNVEVGRVEKVRLKDGSGTDPVGEEARARVSELSWGVWGCWNYRIF